MISVTLNTTEIHILDRQHPSTMQDGGFQKLLVKLQKRLNRQTNELKLYALELDQIPRYAFDYKNGGWENRLLRIFSRTLGRGLGRYLV